METASEPFVCLFGQCSMAIHSAACAGDDLMLGLLVAVRAENLELRHHGGDLARGALLCKLLFKLLSLSW